MSSLAVARTLELEPAPLLEATPCDGCVRAPRCAAEHLACSAFAAFLDGRPWQAAPRVDASRERYERLFG